MLVGQREVAKDQPELSAESILQPPDDRIRVPTRSALEVGVLDQRDGGILRSTDVIAITDRQCEFRGHVEWGGEGESSAVRSIPIVDNAPRMSNGEKG
jgi:hypothetical protein